MGGALMQGSINGTDLKDPEYNNQENPSDPEETQIDQWGGAPRPGIINSTNSMGP